MAPRLKSQITSNLFLHIPASLHQNPHSKVPIQPECRSSSETNLPDPRITTNDPRKLRVIYFITGNPGLISYYHAFLGYLLNLLSAANSNHRKECVVAGFSLGGFEVPSTSVSRGREAEGLLKIASEDGGEEEMDLIWPEHALRKDIYGLRDQIELSYARLEGLIRALKLDVGVEARTSDGDKVQQGHGEVEVILIGHSVGAYIALEIVRMWHERFRSHSSVRVMSTSPGREDKMWKPTAAILLTPTIIDIAKSSSGKIATPLLSYIPFFPQIVQFASRTVTAGMSDDWVKWIVSRVTSLQGSALDTTVEFLRSEKGVKQALWMARDEMVEIGEDRWGEGVWGVVRGVQKEESSRENLRLYFWFAKKDHWVADVTREEIVRLRSTMDEQNGRRRGCGQTVLIDESEGLVHAWCISQSKLVATRVIDWIKEIVTRNE